MPNPSPTLYRSQQTPSAQGHKSVHHDLVKDALPDWLYKASAARVESLKNITLTMPAWHRSAAASEHQRLKDEMRQAWTAQNNIDRALSKLQDARTFARPLLQQALKTRFGVEDDVEDTWVRLYMPVKTSWWAHDFAKGTQSRTVSLLDAALHNFSSDETFTADSCFITRPDALGQFSVKALKHKISIEQFKALCRELDIGARYQTHLHEFVLSKNQVARQYLQLKVTHSQKQTLRVAARMALLKGDIDRQAFEVVQGMLEDRAQVLWHGKAVRYQTLTMMDTPLTGIVLISAAPLAATRPVPILAYVPHDPEHPLKQYPDSLAFMAELPASCATPLRPRLTSGFSVSLSRSASEATSSPD